MQVAEQVQVCLVKPTIIRALFPYKYISRCNSPIPTLKDKRYKTALLRGVGVDLGNSPVRAPFTSSRTVAGSPAVRPVATFESVPVIVPYISHSLFPKF